MIEDVYPLSPLQEGLYYHWLISPKSSVYFEQIFIRLSGEVDVAILRTSYEYLVNRHPVLKTFFTQEVGNKNLQVVRKATDADFRYNETIASGELIEETKLMDREEGFDLHKGSQIRLTVLRTAADEYELIWSFHHIIMDGWCMNILIEEFLEIYYCYKNNSSFKLKSVTPYAHYIRWLAERNEKKELSFWSEYLEGFRQKTFLVNNLTTNDGTSDVTEIGFEIDTDKMHRLRLVCKQCSITENLLFQAIWGTLLGLYNNTQDAVFGAVVSGRPHQLPNVEHIVGLFINTVPIRVNWTDQDTFKDILDKLLVSSALASEYHYSQLADIQVACATEGALFDNILVFENYPRDFNDDMLHKSGHRSEFKMINSSGHERTNYDFNLIIIPGSSIKLKFCFNEDRINIERVHQIKQHFLNILDQVLKKPEITLLELNYLTDTERHQLLDLFNPAPVEFPKGTIVDLFQEQAAKSAHATA
ncbi:MAG: amino acid adenylation domain protein, partial [Frankiales bacterium]|nr:amino acid adenylation domain protein [Frankiales bacterium]